MAAGAALAEKATSPFGASGLYLIVAPRDKEYINGAKYENENLYIGPLMRYRNKCSVGDFNFGGVDYVNGQLTFGHPRKIDWYAAIVEKHF